MPQANSKSHRDTTAPPSPKPPGVNQSAWEKSVERKKLRDLSVHDVGAIVFNESRSFSDRPDSNEPIGAARQKMAHAIMNGDEKWGPDRQKRAATALPIEPSEKALENPTS